MQKTCQMGHLRQKTFFSFVFNGLRHVWHVWHATCIIEGEAGRQPAGTTRSERDRMEPRPEDLTEDERQLLILIRR